MNFSRTPVHSDICSMTGTSSRPMQIPGKLVNNDNCCMTINFRSLMHIPETFVHSDKCFLTINPRGLMYIAAIPVHNGNCLMTIKFRGLMHVPGTLVNTDICFIPFRYRGLLHIQTRLCTMATVLCRSARCILDTAVDSMMFAAAISRTRARSLCFAPSISLAVTPAVSRCLM